jgi:hypothetical protein
MEEGIWPMMTIREAQMWALMAHQREPFERRLAQDMEAAYPDRTYDLAPEALRDRVHAAVNNALRFGFHSDAEVATFVELTFYLGPGFWDDPKQAHLRAILESHDLPAHKSERLEGAVFYADDEP